MKKKKGLFFIVVAVVVVAICFFAFNRNSVDVFDYVDITFEGPDGNGKLSIQEKNVDDEKTAKVLDSCRFYVISGGEMIENINTGGEARTGDLYLYRFTNGDKVEIGVECNEDVLKDTHTRIKKDSKTVTVDGLLEYYIDGSEVSDTDYETLSYETEEYLKGKLTKNLVQSGWDVDSYNAKSAYFLKSSSSVDNDFAGIVYEITDSGLITAKHCYYLIYTDAFRPNFDEYEHEIKYVQLMDSSGDKGSISNFDDAVKRVSSNFTISRIK